MKLNKEKLQEELFLVLQAMIKDESLLPDFGDFVQDNFFSWDQNLVKNREKINLPNDISNENLSSARAVFDMCAAYILFHNFADFDIDDLDFEEQKIANEFEKIRVISCLKEVYLGSAKNILNKANEDILFASQNLALILLNEIFSSDISSQGKIMADDLASSLPEIVVGKIKNLANLVLDQKLFLNLIKEILQDLRQEEQLNEEEKNEEDEENKDEEDVNMGQENLENKPDFDDEKNDEISGDESEDISNQDGALSDEMALDDFEENAQIKNKEKGRDEDEIKYVKSYKIFSSKFDEVIYPSKILSENDLAILRDQLDLKLADLDQISKKMTLKLKKKLLSKRLNFSSNDSSRGILDRKKLTKLVTGINLEDIWVNVKNNDFENSALTILLDNSGSMRGTPIVMAALACEIIATILEKFALKVEIIGFTTADWRGGKSRKLWQEQGGIKNPGRLNDLRHIIYKSFNEKFKKARLNLGLMLKEGFLKENIDGEALLFASSRLMQRDEQRKILMVLSDGTPVDDSTNLANDEDILTNHLHHVIKRIEREKKIELIGVGIGHSTENFYQNAISIKNIEELGDVMIEKIIKVI